MPLLLLLLAHVLQPVAPGRPLRAQDASRAIAEAAAAVDLAVAAIERGEGERALERARAGARPATPEADRAARLYLGTLERGLYLHDAATRTLQPLADTSAGRALDAIGVAAAMELSALLQRRGRVAETRTLMLRVLRDATAIGDRSSAADAEIVLAGLDARAGRIAEAWEHLARADSIIGDGDPGIRARVHCQRAAMLGFGARSTASAEARKGAALAASAGKRRIEATCHFAMGAGFAQRGVADSAMPALTRTVTLARESRDDATLSAALQWRGYLERTLGRPGDAWADLTAAIEAGLRSDTRNPVAWSWLNLGLLSLSLRDPATASASLRAAISEFEQQGDQWGLHTALQSHAAVLAQLEEFDAAERATQRVREWGRTVGNRTSELDALSQLAGISRARGDYPRARARLDSLSRLADHPDLRAWKDALTYPRALVALAERRLPEAERLLRAHLTTLNDAQITTRFATQARLAEVLALRGRLPEAADALAGAMTELEKQRLSLSDPALRQLVFQSGGTSAEATIGVATVIGAVATGGAVDVAFDLAERRRARELADRMVRLAALGDGAEVRWQRVSAPVSLGQFQSVLRSTDAAALVYVAGGRGEPLTLFVVADGTASAVSLVPADSVDRLARRALALLESPGASATAVLRELHALLVTPALPHLPGDTRRLVIVPEGPVHRIPFAALEDAQGVPLAATHAVTVVPSATVLSELRRLPTRADPVRMLALGDPTLDLTAVSDVAATNRMREVFLAAGATGTLPGARREVQRVSRFAPSRDVRTGTRATATPLRASDLSAYRVVHIASHAVIDDASPLRTAIALAVDGSDAGFVTSADLAGTRFDADLVVLSACRTARGLVLDGEGEQGLATTLLASGARAVVVSHWQVRDAATADLMVDLYAALAAGAAAGDALAEAQRAAIHRGEPAAVWAAFTVIGDPLAAPPLRMPRDFPVGWTIALLLVASLAVAWAARRQRGSTVTTSSR